MSIHAGGPALRFVRAAREGTTPSALTVPYRDESPIFKEDEKRKEKRRA